MSVAEKRYKLTLDSHPGKALVMKINDSDDKHFDLFTIGDEDKALEVTLNYNKSGHCEISY